MFFNRKMTPVDEAKYRLLYEDQWWLLWRKREATGDWSTFRLIRPASKVKRSFWLGWNKVGRRFAEQNDLWVLRTFHPEMEAWVRAVATSNVDEAGPAPSPESRVVSPVDRSFPLALAIETLEMVDKAFAAKEPLGVHGSLPDERHLPIILASRFKMNQKIAALKVRRLVEMGVLKKKKLSTKTGVTGFMVDWGVWNDILSKEN
jgi:hypothetical protein